MSEHLANALGQRGWKRHPSGRSKMEGTMPGMGCSSCLSPRVGTGAEQSLRVRMQRFFVQGFHIGKFNDLA